MSLFGLYSVLSVSVLIICCCLVAQLCPTLCDPMDYTVSGILQARILEWAVPFFRASSQPRSPTLQVASLPAA